MSSRNLLPVAALALSLLCGPLGAEGGPVYSLSADAQAGFVLAGGGVEGAFDPTSASTALAWVLGGDLLHRVEAPGWGFVLSQAFDLAGNAESANPSLPPTDLLVPRFKIYEAYARLDLGDRGQLFFGKRRLGLGLGTTFAPGDLLDPRSGFWDQKNGFRGLGLTASLGSDLALRAALGLDRNLEAYAAGLRAKASASLPAKVAAEAAYSSLLGQAGGPADPRLFVWALSADWQADIAQLAAAAVYAPDRFARPSLGLSLDLDGLIVQAEGAADFGADPATLSPDLFGTAGLRTTFSGEADSLTLSLDYAYNGAAGLLLHRHYLLPSLMYSRPEVLDLTVRTLVELEAPSALLSTVLAFHPAPDFDLEFTGSFCLGASGGEFAALPSPPTPATTPAATALGLCARVHF